MQRSTASLAILFGVACYPSIALSQEAPASPELPPAARAEPRWMKGNLHTHSLWSDGNDFPEMIVDWYARHGYQFLALSDHNVLGQGQKWLAVAEANRRAGQDGVARYRRRFGDDWVESASASSSVWLAALGREAFVGAGRHEAGHRGCLCATSSRRSQIALREPREEAGKPMKTNLLKAAICLGISASLSFSPPAPVAPPANDRITQISVINALMLGHYDGFMPIPELLRLGDFGLGTLDHLDGELILLDGRAYQARGDGVVAEVTPDRSTPFAVVVPFAADGGFTCPQVEALKDLDTRLDEVLPKRNNFVAIRIDGRFASITVRSVRRQEPPYAPLAEVAKSQGVWTHNDLPGTLIGIRCPAWTVGLNVPGYHWHFISDDRKIGGHVLDCRIRHGKVRYDVCRDWLVKLDGSEAFNRADLGQDLGQQLRRVESSRTGEEKTGDKKP